MNPTQRLFVLVLSVYFLAACSFNDSMNKIVQNGGTILLSLGAYEEIGHENLTAGDFTATLTDSLGSEAQVSVRAVFPLSVDRTSQLNNYESDGAVFPEHRNGYSGFWFVVVDLIDTSTGQPTTFQEGAATLRVSGLPSVKENQLTIVPGQGSTNPIMGVATTSVLDRLFPASQVKYLVSDPTIAFTENNLLGAIEWQFDYPSASISGLPRSQWPRVYSATNNEGIQIQSFTRSDGSTNTLHVVVLNPSGIGRVSDVNAEAAEYYQSSDVETIRFSIVYPDEVGQAPFASPSVLSAVDVAGAAANIDSLVMQTSSI